MGTAIARITWQAAAKSLLGQFMFVGDEASAAFSAPEAIKMWRSIIVSSFITFNVSMPCSVAIAIHWVVAPFWMKDSLR